MPNNFPDIINRIHFIGKISEYFERLGWTQQEQINHIRNKYGITRSQLNDVELLDLFKYLQQIGNDKSMKIPIQKIFFGSPGTGKSHKISNDNDGGIVYETLGIDKKTHPENLIKTVFHPEYTYGDFLGKLMPQTKSDGSVYYQFYEGHFLKALAQAYKNIIAQKEGESIQNVALVIDEINRGNSSAIFGIVFQLLDRGQDGYSAYGIDISSLEFRKLVELIGFKLEDKSEDRYLYGEATRGKFLDEYQSIFDKIHIQVQESKVVGSSIRIPPNLSIFGTMNTSDSSIYFMDNAFKRRWEWEYIDWKQNSDEKIDSIILEGYGNNSFQWKQLVESFNLFIKDNCNSVRSGKIEDMQIGYHFISTGKVTEAQIKNKLMFFVWDSVFNRDKNPLRELLGLQRNGKELVTFGDFIKYDKEFVENLLSYKQK
ncbi:restriction endonuclease [Nostoc sphaeroides]|uniref:Restriction enzyme n=1 Tax=Nostoc sphaeroides CCNUC1 TaxID=2653204 RepID=A0A5P8WJB2_9NOSO|nr:restriction endonuclease [Nostoc sphaeroides]QFS52670.1 restriction enzyme [Nostoc sphaeroides CCNUC1]